MNKLKIVELFAGIGAWSKALERLNIEHEVVYVVEFDKKTIDSYNIIHNTNFEPIDITQINPKSVPDCDIIFYSPPCQAFSIAGKQNGFGDPRGTLFFDAFKIIQEKKPKYAIMENVKGLTQKKFQFEFETMFQLLEQEGYKNYWKVLNAKDYGIPQNRERVFIISIRNDIEQEFEFPKSFDNGLRLRDLLEEEVDEKFYIGADKVEKLIRELKEKDFLNVIAVKGDLLTRNNPQRQYGFNEKMFTIRSAVQHGVLIIDDTQGFDGIRYYEDIVPSLRSQRSGLKTLEVRPCLTPDRINKRQNGRRFKENNDPSFTINTQDKHGILQIGLLDIKGNEQIRRVYSPEGISPTISTMQGGNRQPKIILVKKSDKYYFVSIRKLTPLECIRLMGFDDEDYIKLKNKKISNSQIYKMAGNSIVIDVVEAILKQLFIHNNEKVINKK
ncbi:DNA cytosine methyltransferase [Paenibacillus naphthalenovorans]|uniref:Cytosine-specific methyltransferase n=1 Tax=Paenibacillus naphthalenovorans TaxID=162209 RepID=A0A0U2UJP6_9BACL|nr:DNA cytosine methyltransferase [Paenibacillus naphthalenovorans]ALS22145.1 modification methylase HhaI [Paenibacillus naphthalenovorans]